MLEELKNKLVALGVEETRADEIVTKAATDGVTDLDSAALLTVDDLIGYGLPKITARKLAESLKKAAAPAATTHPTATASAMLLPSIPSDDTFLESLRVGGILKTSPTDVLSAARALFASRLGLFDIEDRFLAEIEARAEKLGEPVPEIFYELEKASTRKAQADVLKALGVRGTFVSEKRKKAFLTRMEGIWGILSGFQDRIHAWRANWQANMNNPGAMMQMVAALASGGAALAVSGLNDTPDTAVIVDAATSVIDEINKMFAGSGIPVARALAAEAVELRQFVERPELISALGVGSREEMLKTLKLAVGADLIRAERSVSQYILGILELPKMTDDRLAMYIVALETLGTNIPFESLYDGRVNGTAGKRTPHTVF